jgi:transcriptional regulator with XRE-family HTH domain
MLNNILNTRRRKLGVTIGALARLSGVPVATVNRILRDPAKARFEKVAAVGNVLGIDYANARIVPVKRVLRERATQKARYVAAVVQGTQGLEAAGLDSEGYERLVVVATETLLAGKKRKLWDED